MLPLPPVASLAPVDLRRALSRAKCLILDLDGPVASVFAGAPADRIAGELLRIADGHGCPLAELSGCADPIAVLLRHTEELKRDGASDVGRRRGRAVAEMHDALDAWERKAAETATPTPGAADFVRLWHSAGRHLSVATNNCADAAVRCLERQALLDCLDGPVVGRPRDATLMKPDPYPLRRAMIPGIPAEDHLMVGDTVTDLLAAGALSMPFCGYHRSQEGRRRLRAAGGGPVAASMGELTSAARALGL
ncbi:HAD family hydrolase [Streptomyces sp. MUM 178J]|uniref:HAD family hydrolase n=1 Tax=Streptomyces sp. MUM 178J TaxID=2791991 RepID=UPI001F03D664|nr:HAD family hydrolase [Streptomyces sp. MUM 178J]WRQ82991.1 HAD hydrolase-like protein [Streptomyces sp. MUM 178J]